MTTLLTLLVAVPLGWFLWTWAEYMLHRFAMHHLHGKGIMSREHLEHHVTSGWSFSSTHLLSWTGMLLVGFLGWAPLFGLLVSPAFGLGIAVGWAVGYFFYEYQHMVSHLRPPASRYQRLVRRHHFHHHFGAPMRNHGVSLPFWDVVFGTREQPEQVRVPRRLALPWLVDADGELRPEFAADYVLVGDRDTTERLAKLDRARAFASVAPEA
jgi:sterol desaturase/sphingolipid hydroxylase (fatty acid hydroxylase superfamily)